MFPISAVLLLLVVFLCWSSTGLTFVRNFLLATYKNPCNQIFGGHGLVKLSTKYDISKLQ